MFNTSEWPAGNSSRAKVVLAGALRNSEARFCKFMGLSWLIAIGIFVEDDIKCSSDIAEILQT